MRDYVWNSWGASVIGPQHAKAGLPNQDFWLARRYKGGNVIAVSDGLGSKPHSDHGSRAVCRAVCEAAKHYRKNPPADVVDLLRHIHANWLGQLPPHAVSECSATCLFAVRSHGRLTLGRLGDGMIVVHGESPRDSFVLSEDKEDSFANCTHALGSELRPREWETVTIEEAQCKAVLIYTDGIVEGIAMDGDRGPESHLEFTRELSSQYMALSPGDIRKDLKKWLGQWSFPDNYDDKTIACLFKQEGQ